MIPRHVGESQRHYVDRTLRAHGSIATQDALYHLEYQDGRRFSITRLAAIIHDLRHEDGWDIATSGGSGETAVYHLRYCPPLAGQPQRAAVAPVVEAVTLDLEPVAPIVEASLPEWARAWRCADCGSRPASEPAPMLGDLGRAPCPSCGAARYFRRAA